MVSNQGPSPALLTPRIAAFDGKGLVTRILGQLRSPYLRRVVAVSYRYNDFDMERGARASAGSSNGLVMLLQKALENGASVTVMTSNPFSDPDTLPSQPLRRWYQGLKRLRDGGAVVKIHPQLHAKVYLFESEGHAPFFAVGSSNLTWQGMGFLWAECNAGGYHEAEFEVVDRQVAKLIMEKGVEALDDWERGMRRTAQGLFLVNT